MLSGQARSLALGSWTQGQATWPPRGPHWEGPLLGFSAPLLLSSVSQLCLDKGPTNTKQVLWDGQSWPCPPCRGPWDGIRLGQALMFYLGLAKFYPEPEPDLGSVPPL